MVELFKVLKHEGLEIWKTCPDNMKSLVIRNIKASSAIFPDKEILHSGLNLFGERNTTNYEILMYSKR